MEILEVQVKPEFTAQYEAAVKERMAWRKDNGYPFQVSAFQLSKVFIGSSRASAPGVVVTSLISGSHHSGAAMRQHSSTPCSGPLTTHPYRTK